MLLQLLTKQTLRRVVCLAWSSLEISKNAEATTILWAVQCPLDFITYTEIAKHTSFISKSSEML